LLLPSEDERVNGVATAHIVPRPPSELGTHEAGAWQRAELVGLAVQDLAFGPGGVTITLRRSPTSPAAVAVAQTGAQVSKTDPQGRGPGGRSHGRRLETCAVRALQRQRCDERRQSGSKVGTRICTLER
jgi:hypothetical protein